jgi:glycosyltransferase involved in cell wall biosynthesis
MIYNKHIPSVTVLMSTYNGEKYLEEQLKSIFEQKGVKVKVIVRDDGSMDNTTLILNKWSKKSDLIWYQGSNIGVGNSFMELVYQADASDYYAFSDQDDVWDSDKLLIGINKIKEKNQNTPILYFSEYIIVDEKLSKIKKSNTKKFITFSSALIENKAIGCSIIFNKKAKEFASKFRAENIYVHDAWMFRICFAVGDIIYDPSAHFKYRQHDNNVVGAKMSIYHKWISRLGRTKILLNRQKINTINQVNRCCKDYITDAKKVEVLSKYIDYKKSIPSKLRLITDAEVRMESIVDTALFKFAVLIGRA